MEDDEAIAECRRWLAAQEARRDRAQWLQRAARLAKEGKQSEADEILHRVDRNPIIYDAPKLEEAVRWLIHRT